MDRRSVLLSLAATTLLAAAEEPRPTVTRLRNLLDRMFEDNLAASPQEATRLGFDTGERAAAKFRLDGYAIADLQRDKDRTARQLAELTNVDRASLDPAEQAHYDAAFFTLSANAAAGQRYAYGYEGAGRPYVVSPLTGAYQDLPDFLGSQHTINNRSDCEAYLARLAGIAGAFDGETERIRRDAALGVIPPDFIIERALTQMRALRVDPATSPLVRSLVDRAHDADVSEAFGDRAADIVRGQVYPALDRQIGPMEEFRSSAGSDAGVWRLPDGDAYYRDALRSVTTTTLSPSELHDLGREQVRELSERAQTILSAQGLTQGSVGSRMAALMADPHYHYANTDAAKEQLISDLNTVVREMWSQLPAMFATLPTAAVEIRRVPHFIEAGAPVGSYTRPALDGSRPGIYWINLRDTSEHARWRLRTIAYHETVPGHHLQRSLQQQADIPLTLRTARFPAFAEGWALYSEQLALEMGQYRDDPLGELGQIQASLFRAVRLMIDTGLHDLRWTRERAIETLMTINGDGAAAAATEIDRYCVWPGQACAYMVGKLTFLRLRAQCQSALSRRFDIRAFHDAALQGGAMPLGVLDAVVARWAASTPTTP